MDSRFSSSFRYTSDAQRGPLLGEKFIQISLGLSGWNLLKAVVEGDGSWEETRETLRGKTTRTFIHFSHTYRP